MACIYIFHCVTVQAENYQALVIDLIGQLRREQVISMTRAGTLWLLA